MDDFLSETCFYLRMAFLVILLVFGLAGVSVLLDGCVKPKQSTLSPYYNWDYLAREYNMVPPFETEFTVLTPTGVRIDPSDNEIEMGLVDVIIDRVERCMYDKFNSGEDTLYIPEDIRRAAYCTSARPTYQVDRFKVRIKIPFKVSGWHWSLCSGQQVLSWEAPVAACASKGVDASVECPCSWRAGVQDNGVIVSTPNLYLFPDWFVRVHFGCLNPWGHPAVAECAKPQTTLDGDLI